MGDATRHKAQIQDFLTRQHLESVSFSSLKLTELLSKDLVARLLSRQLRPEAPPFSPDRRSWQMLYESIAANIESYKLFIELLLKVDTANQNDDLLNAAVSQLEVWMNNINQVLQRILAIVDPLASKPFEFKHKQPNVEDGTEHSYRTDSTSPQHAKGTTAPDSSAERRRSTKRKSLDHDEAPSLDARDGNKRQRRMTCPTHASSSSKRKLQSIEPELVSVKRPRLELITDDVEIAEEEDADDEAEFIPNVQFEDISAEVDARILERDRIRADERLRLQDFNTKRKMHTINWIEGVSAATATAAVAAAAKDEAELDNGRKRKRQRLEIRSSPPRIEK